MSIFLQEWERRLLEHAYTFLKEKGVIDGDSNHCVLCFDGMMVLKKNVEDVQTLINELQEYLKSHTGFNISFDDKAMDKGYKHIEQAPLRNLEVFDAQYMQSLESYYRKKEYIEMFVVKIQRPHPRYVYAQREYIKDKYGLRSVFKIITWCDPELKSLLVGVTFEKQNAIRRAFSRFKC